MFYLAKVPKEETQKAAMYPTYVFTNITESEVSIVDSLSGDVLLAMSPGVALDLATNITSTLTRNVPPFEDNASTKLQLQQLQNDFNHTNKINDVLKHLLLFEAKCNDEAEVDNG